MHMKEVVTLLFAVLVINSFVIKYVGSVIVMVTPSRGAKVLMVLWENDFS